MLIADVNLSWSCGALLPYELKVCSLIPLPERELGLSPFSYLRGPAHPCECEFSLLSVYLISIFWFALTWLLVIINSGFSILFGLYSLTICFCRYYSKFFCALMDGCLAYWPFNWKDWILENDSTCYSMWNMEEKERFFWTSHPHGLPWWQGSQLS